MLNQCRRNVDPECFPSIWLMKICHVNTAIMFLKLWINNRMKKDQATLGLWFLSVVVFAVVVVCVWVFFINIKTSNVEF